MGTTLTGTTPQDTYDSLIKVTDNGPLSGSLKTLTDGLGNDSALALSTGAASITGTLAVSTNASIGATPESWFSGYKFLQINNFTAAAFQNSSIYLGHNYYTNTAGNDIYRNNGFATTYAQFSGNHVWSTAPTGTAAGAITFTERMRITSTGDVGIGTSAPDKKLQVVGPVGVASTTSVLNSSNTGIYASTGGNTSNYNGIFFQGVSSKDMYFGRKGEAGVDDLVVSTAEASPVEIARFRKDGGLTFNGDTAAANALDDYEEGTWTMGVSFGGGTTGITYSAQSGTYTKVGRKVTLNGYFALTSKGSDTGAAKITGLPFNIGSSLGNYAAVSLWLGQVSYANSPQAIGAINAQLIELWEVTEGGTSTVLNDVNFANNSEVIVNFTYFV